jgi:PadR family transcriptional regulator, regulatory protein PadR
MGLDALGPLEQSVLYAILRLGDDAYGVTIRREIADQTGKDASFGAIYTTLERLEKKGFIRSRMGEATAARGGRAKKYFEVTGAGEAALNNTEKAIAAMSLSFGRARA